MATLQLLRTFRVASTSAPRTSVRSPSKASTRTIGSTSLAKSSLAKTWTRSIHTQTPLQSMMTRMRPELAGNDLWKRKSQDDSPEYKQELVKLANWWHQMNTDKMANFLEHDLDNGGRVRHGIVEKFMLKAYKAEHLKTLHRSMSWLSARWGYTFTDSWVVPLCRAAWRARNADMALRILNSAWLRVRPNTNSNEYLLRICYELEEEKSLFKSPNPTDYNPYRKEENPVNDWVAPKKGDEDDVEEAKPKSYGRHGGGDDEDDAKKNAKVEVDYGMKDLDKTFEAVVAYAFDARHGRGISPRLFAAKARFYAAKGDLKTTEDILSHIKNNMTAPVVKEFPSNRGDGSTYKTKPLELDAILPTAYLASGKPQAALDALKASNANVDDIAVRRLQVAALFAAGKDAEAVAAIRASGNVNQYQLIATHLGNHNTVDKIRAAYETFESEGIEITKDTKEYLKTFDSLLPPRPEPVVAEEAAQPTEEAAKEATA